MHRICALLFLLAAPAAADTVVATRTIRPQQVLSAADIRLEPNSVDGAHSDPSEVIGKEARIAIYPGRPIMFGALGDPALVERNQYVELVYQHAGLRIIADGRALGRGAIGDRVRVMNESSRSVLFGTITADGTILVSK